MFSILFLCMNSIATLVQRLNWSHIQQCTFLAISLSVYADGLSERSEPSLVSCGRHHIIQHTVFLKVDPCSFFSHSSARATCLSSLGLIELNVKEMFFEFLLCIVQDLHSIWGLLLFHSKALVSTSQLGFSPVRSLSMMFTSLQSFFFSTIPQRPLKYYFISGYLWRDAQDESYHLSASLNKR